MSFVTLVMTVAPLIAPMIALFSIVVWLALNLLGVGYFCGDRDFGGVIIKIPGDCLSKNRQPLRF